MLFRVSGLGVRIRGLGGKNLGVRGHTTFDAPFPDTARTDTLPAATPTGSKHPLLKSFGGNHLNT